MTDKFPERLRKLRETKRPLRSMAVTSELIGLPHSSIRKYERGEAKPSAESLAAIADYFSSSCSPGRRTGNAAPRLRGICR